MKHKLNSVYFAEKKGKKPVQNRVREVPFSIFCIEKKRCLGLKYRSPTAPWSWGPSAKKLHFLHGVLLDTCYILLSLMLVSGLICMELFSTWIFDMYLNRMKG